MIGHLTVQKQLPPSSFFRLTMLKKWIKFLKCLFFKNKSTILISYHWQYRLREQSLHSLKESDKNVYSLVWRACIKAALFLEELQSAVPSGVHMDSATGYSLGSPREHQCTDTQNLNCSRKCDPYPFVFLLDSEKKTSELGYGGASL